MGRGDRRDERNYSEADSASTWRRGSPLEPSMPDQRRSQGMRNQGSRPQGESEADNVSSWRKAPSDVADESGSSGFDGEGGGYERGGYDRERSGYDRGRGGFDRGRGGFDNRDKGGYDRERGGYERERGGYDRERGGYDRERGGYDRERGGYDRERGGYDRGRYDRESDTASSWRSGSPSARGRESNENARDVTRPERENEGGQSQGTEFVGKILRSALFMKIFLHFV